MKNCNTEKRSRESKKISSSSFGKIDKYEYLTSEEILSPDQRRVIDQATFAYSPLEKAFENQTKTLEDQGIKEIEALKALKPKEGLKALKPEENQELESIEGFFPKNMRTDEIKNEIEENRKGKQKIKRKYVRIGRKN